MRVVADSPGKRIRERAGRHRCKPNRQGRASVTCAWMSCAVVMCMPCHLVHRNRGAIDARAEAGFREACRSRPGDTRDTELAGGRLLQYPGKSLCLSQSLPPRQISPRTVRPGSAFWCASAELCKRTALAAIEQNNETKSLRLQERALAVPGAALFPRRRA